jgi:transposase
MERRQYTREFKLEAVRLIKERGVSYVQAAEDLGVHPTQLRDWGEEACGRSRTCIPRPRSDEARSSWRSRSSSARGRQAEGRTGHPKKAAAYFAKEST